MSEELNNEELHFIELLGNMQSEISYDSHYLLKHTMKLKERGGGVLKRFQNNSKKDMRIEASKQ